MRRVGYLFTGYAVLLLIFGSMDFIPAATYGIFLIGLGMVLEEL